MTRPGLAVAAIAALAASAPWPVAAHQLNVFASTDCEVILVEAKFSSGRAPVMGEVRVRDGANALLATRDLGADGTLSLPLAEFDASTGLLVEVDIGDHDDYWILTPEDIARKCRS